MLFVVTIDIVDTIVVVLFDDVVVVVDPRNRNLPKFGQNPVSNS